VAEHAATREAFNRALIEFITRLVRTRTNATDGVFEIDESTPLFETGLIDSLGVLELIAFVEERTRRAIPIHKVDLRFFRTVECISRNFWRDAKEHAHGQTILPVGAGQNRA
jgi:acyl carrier protein